MAASSLSLERHSLDHLIAMITLMHTTPRNTQSSRERHGWQTYGKSTQTRRGETPASLPHPDPSILMAELAKQIIRQQWLRRHDRNPATRLLASNLIKTHVVMLRQWRKRGL